jgi:hypothetical protein
MAVRTHRATRLEGLHVSAGDEDRVASGDTWIAGDVVE